MIFILYKIQMPKLQSFFNGSGRYPTRIRLYYSFLFRCVESGSFFREIGNFQKSLLFFETPTLYGDE